MSETPVAFARVCLCGVETAIAFAGEKWVFLVHFPGAEVMPVSPVLCWGRAVVLLVSMSPRCRASVKSWGCAQVVDGLFVRLLSRPLGVVRIRWGDLPPRLVWLRCRWVAAGPGSTGRPTGGRREACWAGGGCGAGGRWQGQGGPRDRALRAELACGDLAGGPPPTGAQSSHRQQDACSRRGRRAGGQASRRTEVWRRDVVGS